MLTPVGGAAQRAGSSPVWSFFRCRPTFRWLGKIVAGVSSVMELQNAYVRRLEIAGVFVFCSQSTSYNEVLSSTMVWFGVSCIFLSVD